MVETSSSNQRSMDEFSMSGYKHEETTDPIATIRWVLVGIFALVLPLSLVGAYQSVQTQSCTITSTTIIYQHGWLFRVDKRMPIDQVLEASVVQGCVDNCFGVYSVTVETAAHSNAGQNGTNRPEVVLFALKDADHIRDLIMQRRDQLCLPAYAPPAVAIPAPVATSHVQIAIEVEENNQEALKLREEIAKLEAQKQKREIEQLRAQLAQLQAEKEQKTQ